jgi:hypothetical protein
MNVEAIFLDLGRDNTGPLAYSLTWIRDDGSFRLKRNRPDNHNA